MKQLFILITLVLVSLSAFALTISPETISQTQFGGECKQIPLTINNSGETDLVAYLYYSTDLNDTEGLTLKAENPFVAKKGDTQIPLQICTVPEFAPSTFNLTLFANANIEERLVPYAVYKGGSSGTRVIYQDKNVFVDRNVVIQVPKEIIKEIQVTKEVPVEKIIYIDKDMKLPETVAGTPDALGWLIIGLILVGIAVIASYLIFTKKQGGDNDGS